MQAQEALTISAKKAMQQHCEAQQAAVHVPHMQESGDEQTEDESNDEESEDDDDACWHRYDDGKDGDDDSTDEDATDDDAADTCGDKSGEDPSE